MAEEREIPNDKVQVETRDRLDLFSERFAPKSRARIQKEATTANADLLAALVAYWDGSEGDSDPLDTGHPLELLPALSRYCEQMFDAYATELAQSLAQGWITKREFSGQLIELRACVEDRVFPREWQLLRESWIAKALWTYQCSEAMKPRARAPEVQRLRRKRFRDRWSCIEDESIRSELWQSISSRLSLRMETHWLPLALGQGSQEILEPTGYRNDTGTSESAQGIAGGSTGIQLDYARAKAEADLGVFLQGDCNDIPGVLRAADRYLDTITDALIARHLRPDSEDPDRAVEDFRSAIRTVEKYLWKEYIAPLAFGHELDLEEIDLFVGHAPILSRRWDHAVTDFWSQRAEHLAKLGAEPLPSAAFAASDTKPSVEPARAEPPTVDGAAASDSSNSGRVVDATPATLASAQDVADLHVPERMRGTGPLSLADRTEIEQQLQQWRNGISVDVCLLLNWSAELAVATPPESMEYFRDLLPDQRSESFLRLAFDWEGSGREILNHDQITATLLKNLQKALSRYAHGAIRLISSKWAKTGIQPNGFASRMESAGEALEQDVFQMLKDGVSALAKGASTDSLEQVLSGQLRGDIVQEIELYRRNAQLVGLCELPERDDAVLESPTEQEDVKPVPGKERKGDASLLADRRSVSFRTAELYLGITERQRQYLVRDQKLTVEGKGQNRKITTDSLRTCLPPENPK